MELTAVHETSKRIRTLASETYKSTLEFIRPMDEPAVVEAIRQTLSPAKVFSRLFSEDDCDWLFKYAWSGTLKVRRNVNGTVFMYGAGLNDCYTRFQDIIEEILPGARDSVAVDGNFFLTPSRYGIHNDSPRQADYVEALQYTPAHHPNRRFITWKNLIIPLWQGPVNARSQIVFFDQRHIDWAHVYNHGASMPNISTQYPIAEDHSKLTFHDGQGRLIARERNSLPYDREHYKTYLDYTPYERLTGLTPELTCDWVPGCPMTFDAVQLHATNQGSPAWRTKMGLLLTFLKEI
jgi:hypothetical protein